MHKGRLEAFSDGVIAIILTVMVLELKIPHGAGLEELRATLPTFLSYVLSFVYVGIYWSNHHHLLQAAERVNGRVLWANLHLLFWLSLIPFTTAWAGENHFAAAPVAVYGVVLALCGAAYYVLALTLVNAHGEESRLAHALGRDQKTKISVALYLLAIPAAFWLPALSLALYVAVALLWIVPDSRIEQSL